MPEPFQQFQLVAIGSIAGTTGARLAGGANITPARTGTGVYTLTANAASFAASTTLPVCNMNANGIYRAVVTSPTVITVSTFLVDGNTAADRNFTFMIFVAEPS